MKVADAKQVTCAHRNGVASMDLLLALEPLERHIARSLRLSTQAKRLVVLSNKEFRMPQLSRILYFFDLVMFYYVCVLWSDNCGFDTQTALCIKMPP